MNRKQVYLITTLFFLCFNLAFSQFGKNKVQYDNFEWKYIESEHFTIYFHDNWKYLADYTALSAEDALKSIQRRLGFKITKKINIIVYNSPNQFQQTNIISSFLDEGIGGVTELMKNRVVLPFDGDYSQYRHVVHHELVHAVMNEMFYGGSVQSKFYNNITTQIPIWISEGLAEFESIGGYDAKTDNYMRDIILSGNLKSLMKIDGYEAYRVGQAFFWYIEDKYGKKKIGELLNRLKSAGNINNALQATFRLDLEDFSQKFASDLKAYYLPDNQKFELAPDFAKRLTIAKKDDSFYNSSPALSQNGDKIAFISDRDGYFAIYTMKIRDDDKVKKDNSDKPEKLLSSGRSKDFEQLNFLTPGISWNARGDKLVISAKSGGEDVLFLTDAKTGDYDKISLGFHSISSASFSPLGDRVAFTAVAKERTDLYIYTLRTKKVEQITNDVYVDLHPTWSSDGNKLYFVSDRLDDLSADSAQLDFDLYSHQTWARDIYSIELATKKITRITSEPDYDKTSLATVEGDSKLIFSGSRNGIGNIFQIDLATKAITAKTNSLNDITQITTSKDASKLVFCAQIDGGYDLFYLKSPLDRAAYKDLPLTKYVQVVNDDGDHSLGIPIDSLKFDSIQTKINYGSYEMDFSGQKVITKNTDAVKESDVRSVTKSIGVQNFVAKDYQTDFSTDFIFFEPYYSSFWGVQGTTQMRFSDLLGDQYIGANLYLNQDIKNSSFALSYYYLPKQIDYSVSLFHNAGVTIISYGSSAYYYRFRNYGVNANAALPFDKFNRLEFGFSLAEVTRENIDDPGVYEASKTLLIPSARYVHDDVIWGMHAFPTPIQGSRFFVEAQYSPKIGDDGMGFTTIKTDIRQYFNLGYTSSFALRLTGGGSFGANSVKTQKFFIGGEENWIGATYNTNNQSNYPFDNPEDFYFSDNFIFPLRGYNINERGGSKYFVFNSELRFPVFAPFFINPVPIMFKGVYGDFFFDAGTAWTDKFATWDNNVIGDDHNTRIANDILISSGFGLRLELFGLPVKFDMAWTKAYKTWSTPNYIFSLGYDF